MDRRSLAQGLFALTALAVVVAVAVQVPLTANLAGGHFATPVGRVFTLVPLLAMAGWIACGPRGLVSWRVAALTLLFPVLWGVFTLVRGPIVDFYPYPFIDVRSLGYPRVFVNIVLVGVLFYALAAAAVAVDRVCGGCAAAAGRSRPASRDLVRDLPVGAFQP